MKTLTKEEALQAMEDGHKVRHHYYSDKEFAFMKDGIIYTEDGYSHGTPIDEFWAVIQKWKTGWSIVQG